MDNNGLKDNIDWMVMALQCKFGWAMAYSAWRTVLSFTYSVVSSVIEKFLAGLLPEDKLWVDHFLAHRGYRITILLIKILTSIQLPRAEVVKEVQTIRNTKPI